MHSRRKDARLPPLTAEMLLCAYQNGIFPMAEPDTGEVRWYSPDPRAIFPLDDFRIPVTLLREVRRGTFDVRSDTAFDEVMRACATPRYAGDETWISEEFIGVYGELFTRGFAHSIEAWREGQLVGGLYGVHIGGAFFGESMFHKPRLGGTNASKICLVHLVRHLNHRGFTLLDTQFSTPHLEQFGCVEIFRDEYLRRLGEALQRRVTWEDFEGGQPQSTQRAQR